MKDQGNFIPPYSSSFVQRQMKIRQEREAKKGGSDVLENRCSNGGGSFVVQNCGSRSTHVSQRCFGFARPNKHTFLDSFGKIRLKYERQKEGTLVEKMKAYKDNAGHFAISATYEKIEKSMKAKRAAELKPWLPNNSVTNNLPQNTSTPSVVTTSFNSYVNSEVFVKGNTNKAFFSPHIGVHGVGWPGQVTDSHELLTTENISPNTYVQNFDFGACTTRAVSQVNKKDDPQEDGIYNEANVALLRTSSTELQEIAQSPYFNKVASLRSPDNKDKLAKLSPFRKSVLLSPYISIRTVSDELFSPVLSKAKSSTSLGKSKFSNFESPTELIESKNFLSESFMSTHSAPGAAHVKNTFRHHPYSPFVNSKGKLKGYSVHYVKFIQQSESELPEKVLYGVVCLKNGISRDDLIKEVEKQFGCSGVTDISITYNTTVSDHGALGDRVPQTLSLSLNTLPEQPVLDEGCSIVAYSNKPLKVWVPSNTDRVSRKPWDQKPSVHNSRSRLTGLCASPASSGLYASGNDVLSKVRGSDNKEKNKSKSAYKLSLPNRSRISLDSDMEQFSRQIDDLSAHLNSSSVNNSHSVFYDKNDSKIPLSPSIHKNVEKSGGFVSNPNSPQKVSLSAAKNALRRSSYPSKDDGMHKHNYDYLGHHSPENRSANINEKLNDYVSKYSVSYVNQELTSQPPARILIEPAPEMFTTKAKANSPSVDYNDLDIPLASPLSPDEEGMESSDYEDDEEELVVRPVSVEVRERKLDLTPSTLRSFSDLLSSGNWAN